MIEVDVETRGLQWYYPEQGLFLAQFRDGDGNEAVLRHPEDRAAIQGWLSRRDEYRAWNAKFDFHHLAAAGYTLPDPSVWHDGMVVARILDSRKSAALKAVAERLGIEGATDNQEALRNFLNAERKRRRATCKEGGEAYVEPNYADVPDEIMLPYALADVQLTQMVGAIQYPAVAMDPELQGLYNFEREVLASLYAMERRGLPADAEAAGRLEFSLRRQLDALEQRAVELAGVGTFNPRSSKQIYDALRRRKADLRFVTGQSMDEENLRTVDDDLARLILAYRAQSKMYSTYVVPLIHPTSPPGYMGTRQPLIKDGRIHSNLRQLGARTGRMSSSDPNIQNFPRDDLRLRYLVRAEPGHKLVTVDLDSIELRLFAAFAGPGALRDQMRDPEADPHQYTADRVGLGNVTRSGGEIESARQRGKTFNYAIIYGAGARSIRKLCRVSEIEAKAMKRRYMDTYPEVRTLQAVIERKLYEQGYVTSPVDGRRFEAPAREAYKVTNYLIQGTAAGMLKRAAVRLEAAGVPLVAPVHDELVAHVPEAQAEEAAREMVQAMTEFPEITEHVPLSASADIVDRWSQAKKPDYVPEYERGE